MHTAHWEYVSIKQAITTKQHCGFNWRIARSLTMLKLFTILALVCKKRASMKKRL